MIVPVFLVTIAWEVYEFVFDLFSEVKYLEDTMIDIFLGTGASVAVYILAVRVMKDFKNNNAINEKTL